MRWLFSKVKPTTAHGRNYARFGNTSLKRELATHHVPLTGKLAGRRVDVYRVEHDKCPDCGFLAPTPEGLAKIKRCTQIGIKLFRESLRWAPCQPVFTNMSCRSAAYHPEPVT